MNSSIFSPPSMKYRYLYGNIGKCSDCIFGETVSIDTGGTLCPNLCGTKAGCGGGIHVRNWN